MELLKKKILLNVSATTATTYSFNILLNATIKDMGFFDTLDDTEIVGDVLYSNSPSGYSFINSYDFSNYSGDTYYTLTYNVTGYSASRLSEIEKYVVSTNPFMKFYSGGTVINDGLSSYYSGNTGITYIYYIGGITYVDKMLSGSTAFTTTFTFTNVGFSLNNFDNKRIIKLESKQNMVENSQVSTDVFIARQQQTVFEKNYRLSGIGSISDLLTYAGGNYFRIYNNT